VIARALLGHAARIRVLDLPRETKDISDWFAAGHSECELISMLRVSMPFELHTENELRTWMLWLRMEDVARIQ